MSSKKRSSNNNNGFGKSSKRQRENSDLTNEEFVNLLGIFSDTDTNENTIDLLLQSNDEFNELVRVYNIVKETNTGAVLNIEKQVRDKICFLNQLHFFEEKVVNAQRLILFIFMDFHGHIIKELDRIHERGILI